MFLLATFKEGAGNGFLQLADMEHVFQTCSLDVEVLLVQTT
jgi:hypothetical protein